MKIQIALCTLLILGSINSSLVKAKQTESGAVAELNQAYKNAKNQEEQERYDAAYDAFEAELRAIVERQNNSDNQKVHTVGQYSVTVQTNCEVEVNPMPPILTPFEKDCYSAKSSAEATADMIINTAPENPPSLAAVVGAVTNCELTVSVNKSFSIYNNCWTDQFSAEYGSIMAGFAADMAAKGYTKDPVSEDGTTTFSTETLSRTVNLNPDHVAQTNDYDGLDQTNAGALPANSN